MSLPRTFGWKAWKMADLSFADLEQLRQAVQNDPKNQNPPGSFYLYTPPARKKLDALAWAVTHKLKENKEKSA